MKVYFLKRSNTDPPLYLTDGGGWSILTADTRMFRDLAGAERTQHSLARRVRCDPVEGTVTIGDGS